MTDYLDKANFPSQHLKDASSFSLRSKTKLTSKKRAIAINDIAPPKKQKVDSVDSRTVPSGIEAIPNNPNLDDVLSVLFPDDKSIADMVKAEAETNFNTDFPYILGERRVEAGNFIYDKAEEMVKPYIQSRYHEKYPTAGFEAPSIEKSLFANDRFFLFSGKEDPVISLGTAHDLEAKKLGLTDLLAIFKFSELSESSESHYISMSRLTFSLLLGENAIANSKGVDSSKFSSMLSDEEKTERLSDLMASAACVDGNPLFSLLLQKGVDPLRNSQLFDRTPAELAARDKAEKNLALIEKSKLNTKTA